MTDQFIISHATIADLESVTRLFDAYRVWYHQTSDPDRARSFLQQRLLNNEATVFLARDADGKAAGFALLYPLFSSISMDAVWILNDLFVAETHRGQGLGSILLEAATEFARETGAIRMELEAAQYNTGAQQLYQRHGWTRSEEFQRWIKELG
ncbi:MAG: GNAT family N-acetyltransferase [Planctomycetaceae bacterium]|nr:GNAT family N-acetyltransferase [Planctomycetaceae bacterium]